MKRIIIAALASWLALTSSAAAEITTRVSEADRSGDGQIYVRMKTTYRAGERILGEMLRDGKNTRIFYADNKALMAEEDTTGDGVFDTMWLFEENLPVSAFRRDRDGNLTPFSSEELREGRRRLETWFERL